MNRDILRYGIVLGIITFISALILALTYAVTKDPIAEAVRQDFLAGLEKVLPPFDNAPDEDILVIDGYEIYVARTNGEPVGYAVQTVSTKGYSGDIAVVVGGLPDGTIYGVTVVRHAETPGLGDKITSESFLSLFKGGLLTKKYAVRADGGDIDQFSGATISPRAVTEAVNKAGEVLSRINSAGS